MKVAIFGGSGFVSSYLIEELLKADMRPSLLVRKGSQNKVNHVKKCEIVEGDIHDQATVSRTLKDADCVIYNIGILREFLSKGITFDDLQYQCAARVIDAAQAAGVSRFLLMSANGVKENGTPYQRSKFKAEQYLKKTKLDWTIFRPSVLFGDPKGKMEFATQLSGEIIDPPMPAPLFYSGLLPNNAGMFTMSPAHVHDVAKAFVYSINKQSSYQRTIELGGPDILSWKAILQILAKAKGKSKLMLPVPAFGVSCLALIFDRYAWFPLSRDQITMLLESNACGDEGFKQLGIDPIVFDQASLSYLND